MLKESDTVILTSAFGYKSLDVAPFLNSLESVGYKGKLVLFTDSTLLINTEGLGFRLIPMVLSRIVANPTIIKRVFSSLARRSGVSAFHKRNILVPIITNSFHAKMALEDKFIAHFRRENHIMVWRFICYYNYLLTHPCQGVFVSDLRDVYFQDDPFLTLTETGVHCFRENAAFTIDSEWANRGWIREAFGPEVLVTIGKRRIHCAGTILGTYDEILQFMHDFLITVLKHNVPHWIGGIDQGVFNYLISAQKMPYFITHENGDGVFTMGLSNEIDYDIRDNVVFSNYTDSKPAVVHQYDRHPNLVDLVSRIPGPVRNL